MPKSSYITEDLRFFFCKGSRKAVVVGTFQVHERRLKPCPRNDKRQTPYRDRTSVTSWGLQPDRQHTKSLESALLASNDQRREKILRWFASWECLGAGSHSPRRGTKTRLETATTSTCTTTGPPKIKTAPFRSQLLAPSHGKAWSNVGRENLRAVQSCRELDLRKRRPPLPKAIFSAKNRHDHGSTDLNDLMASRPASWKSLLMRQSVARKLSELKNCTTLTLSVER